MASTRSRAPRRSAAALVVATLVLGSAPAVAAARPATKSKPPATTRKKPVATTAKKAAAAGAITARNFAFSPVVVRVAKGTTVTLTNKDGAPHTWTADGGQWDSGVIAAGSTSTRRFDEVGTFAFHCEIHTSMKGTVEVGGAGTAKAATSTTSAGASTASTYAPPASGGSPSSGGGGYDY